MRVIYGLIACVLLWPLVATATGDSSASNNFRIDESFIGAGGDVQSSSPNFKSDSAIGSIGIGDSTAPPGGSFRSSTSGYVTTSDPALTFVVPASNINFGALSISTTATATSTFSVINYTSYGYIVQAVGNTPASGSHNLTPMSSAAASAQGTEQFGINLVHNISPITFGTDPDNNATQVGGSGAAAAGYSGTGQFKYNSGDTIAQATRTSAQTNYTISYIVNSSTTTAGGTYSGTINLVCTGTY